MNKFAKKKVAQLFQVLYLHSIHKKCTHIN